MQGFPSVAFLSLLAYGLMVLALPCHSEVNPSREWLLTPSRALEGRGGRLEYRILPVVSRSDAWAAPAQLCHKLSLETMGSQDCFPILKWL